VSAVVHSLLELWLGATIAAVLLLLLVVSVQSGVHRVRRRAPDRTGRTGSRPPGP